jgi:hypothetical protein
MKNANDLSDAELDAMLVKKMQLEGPQDTDSLSDAELDKMLVKKMIMDETPEPESQDAMSALQGFGQGATLGYLPQIQTVTEPIADRVFNFGRSVTNLFRDKEEQLPLAEPAPFEQMSPKSDSYLKERDHNIARINQLAEKSPKSYYSGMAGGMLTTGIAAAPAQAATSIAKAKQARNIGALYGFLSNPGDVEGVVKEMQVGERVGNAIIGGFLGYGAQKGLDALAKSSKGMAKKFIEVAEKRVARKEVAADMLRNQTNKTINISQPKTGKDTLQVLKQTAEQIKPTSQTKALNQQYKQLGLEELTPIQMQPRPTGDSTPAQYAEQMLKTRVPKLFEKQLKQDAAFKKVIETFDDMGSSSNEAFGARVNEALDSSLKKVGDQIGRFKLSVSTKPVDKNKLFNMLSKDVELNEFALNKSQLSSIKGHLDKMGEAANIRNLDDFMSQIQGEIDTAFASAGNKGTSYTRTLGQLKKVGNSLIEDMLPEGKPREIYKQYAIGKGLYKDTLKNAFKTGGDNKVLRNITKTSQNFKQFKTAAETLDRPELVTEVRDNYLRDIFKDNRWPSRVRRLMKEDAWKEIVPPEMENKVKLMLQYKDQMMSTTASGLNPSKTGAFNAVRSLLKGDVSKTMEILIGDERKTSKALKKYYDIVHADTTKRGVIEKTLESSAKKLSAISGMSSLVSKHPLAYTSLVYKVASGEKEKVSGPERWQASGLAKLADEEVNFELDKENTEKLLFSKKGQALLNEASEAKKGSIRMNKTIKNIEEYLRGAK